MGWFWADSPKANLAPHPIPQPGATPPAACPMHKKDSSQPSPFRPRADSPSSTPSACPVKSSNHPLRKLAPTDTPPQSSAAQSQSQPPSPPQPQPQQHTSQQSTLAKLNPLNYMPALSNAVPADSPQTISLPLERETSSIPRGDSDLNWEYPSPQQMYNAMLRKGYTDTPADAVESMVAVHNFLNEGAWAEIEEWERIFSQGLGRGWDLCSKGEEGLALERAKCEFLSARREALGLPPNPDVEATKPKLLRFQGRPQEPTPKARILSALGYVFPEKFGGEPPFDRHDWYVARRTPDGSTKEVRYVIDYYSGGVQATGEPVFYLDIRPALDTPTAALERAVRWSGDVWHRARGASGSGNAS